MRREIALLVAGLAALAPVRAQIATTCSLPNSDFLVPPLPGFTASDTNVWPCSYAGTLSANSDNTSNLFFWMFETQDPDNNAPVALWMNGGPGASSMFANWMMNGPLRVTHEGSTDATGYTMEYFSKGSWADKAHMVYLDQPVGTGFSYGSEALLTTMEQAGDEFEYWLTQFFNQFPNLQGRDFYITGESYAGKYIPYYAWKIWNTQQSATVPLWDLRACLVGDPYTDPLTQRINMWNLPTALNLLDETNMPQIQALIRQCQKELAQSMADAADACSNIMGYIVDVTGGIGQYDSGAYPYDSRIFGYDWDPVEQITINYFSEVNADSATIYEAINVSDSTKDPVFEMSSSAVGTAFVNDNLIYYGQYVKYLVDAEVPVLIYAGEFDSQDGAVSQEPWLRELDFNGAQDFWDQGRSIYWVPTPDTSDETWLNGGLYRTNGYLTYLTVPQAGHFVPNNNYDVAYQFFSDYIDYQGLVSHAQAYSDSAPEFDQPSSAMCDYMSDCNGNGTCGSNGLCVCNEGYKFADCSLKTTYLTQIDINAAEGTEYTISNTGPIWNSFTKEAGAAGQMLTLWGTDEAPATCYLSLGKDSDPNMFEHDMAIKGITAKAVQLNSNQLSLLQNADGYSIACYQEAIGSNGSEVTAQSLKWRFQGSIMGVATSFAALAASAALYF